jgi:hypothetical protein
MFLLFQPFAALLGSYEGKGYEWRQNDGLVNARSQTCPKEGVANPVSNCLNPMPTSGRPEPGKYYQMSVDMDHGQVIGLFSDSNGVYRDIASAITSLEGIGSSGDRVSAVDPEFVGEIENNWGVPEGTSSAISTATVAGATVAAVLSIAVGGFVVRRMRSKNKNSSAAVTAPESKLSDPTSLTCERSPSYIEL